MAPTKTYTSGDYEISASEKAKIPNKIKCCRCRKIKNQHAYSGNKLKDVVAKMNNDGSRYNPTTFAYVPCSQCVGGQVNELYCQGCDKWKGTGAFSKMQRKTPDNAYCWPCSEARQNMEPDGSDSDVSNCGSGDTDDSDGSAYGGGGSTVAGTFSSLSITNGASGSSSTAGVAVNSMNASKSGITTTGGNSNGGVKEATSVTGSTVTTRTGVNSNIGLPSGFNTQAYGTPPHLRVKGPGSVNSNAGSKFAKVKAVPKKIVMDAAQHERDRERAEEDDEITVQDSDSDSD